MCLLVVASRLVPGEPLIVGANRDEVLDRPSTSLTVLDAGTPRVLGGRDEQSGGTWLAVNSAGVCVGLTNQPLGDLKDPTRRSRGELPLAAARCTTAAAGVDQLVNEFDPSDYNGAWLLVGDRTSLFFVDFTGDRVSATELGPGIHVLENRSVDVPSPKVDLVRSVVGTPRSGDAVVEAFRRVLADHRIPEGDERGTACISTGSAPVPRAWCGWDRSWKAWTALPRAHGCGWQTGRRARPRTRTCRGSGMRSPLTAQPRTSGL